MIWQNLREDANNKAVTKLSLHWKQQNGEGQKKYLTEVNKYSIPKENSMLCNTKVIQHRHNWCL